MLQSWFVLNFFKKKSRKDDWEKLISFIEKSILRSISKLQGNGEGNTEERDFQVVLVAANSGDLRHAFMVSSMERQDETVTSIE